MRLGKVQYAILQALHESGPMTARALTDSLSQREAVAHSTVQTLLRQLEAKGLVAHEARDRTFVFRALSAPDDAGVPPILDLLNRVYHGSVYGLMAHLLERETLSESERSRLAQLLAEHESKEETP